jgi:hypothetical protein
MAGKRDEKGDLPSREVHGLKILSNAVSKRSVNLINRKMKQFLTETVRRQITAQNRFMRNAGLEGISKTRQNELVNQVVRRMSNTPFPGTDKTTRQRLGMLGNRMAQILKDTVGVNEVERLAAWEMARKRLHERDSSVGVNGGVMSRSLARINRTEQSRAIQEASRLVAKELGVEFMYWRRTPGASACPICDGLAHGTGSDVNIALRKAQVTVPSLEGLYTVSSYPSIPHPHCLCGHVPVII